MLAGYVVHIYIQSVPYGWTNKSKRILILLRTWKIFSTLKCLWYWWIRKKNILPTFFQIIHMEHPVACIISRPDPLDYNFGVERIIMTKKLKLIGSEGCHISTFSDGFKISFFLIPRKKFFEEKHHTITLKYFFPWKYLDLIFTNCNYIYKRFFFSTRC